MAEVGQRSRYRSSAASRSSPKNGSAVPPPRMIAWEITRSCNLTCVHCRASALKGPYEGELSTQECFDLIDDIVSFAQPIIILTGGEPLVRDDIFDIARYALGRGLRVVIGTNATFLTEEMAKQIRELGIPRISVSLDFPTAEEHDNFRGVPGAFAQALEGIRNAQKAGLEVQINTTVTKLNVARLPAVLALAEELGAVAFHPFLLVPTGRGKELKEQELPPEEYERTLNWFYDQQKKSKIFFKPTDAPHYFRIIRQRAKEEGVGVTTEKHGMQAMTRGCLGGIGFCFISHRGDVQPCGYFELKAGNVRKTPFKEIWEHAELFQDLRDLSKLKGKCAICEYKKVCGGCRARAYEVTGDYLAEEPYCIYRPRGDAKEEKERHKKEDR